MTERHCWRYLDQLSPTDLVLMGATYLSRPEYAHPSTCARNRYAQCSAGVLRSPDCDLRSASSELTAPQSSDRTSDHGWSSLPLIKSCCALQAWPRTGAGPWTHLSHLDHWHPAPKKLRHLPVPAACSHIGPVEHHSQVLLKRQSFCPNLRVCADPRFGPGIEAKVWIVSANAQSRRGSAHQA